MKWMKFFSSNAIFSDCNLRHWLLLSVIKPLINMMSLWYHILYWIFSIYRIVSIESYGSMIVNPYMAQLSMLILSLIHKLQFTLVWFLFCMYFTVSFQILLSENVASQNRQKGSEQIWRSLSRAYRLAFSTSILLTETARLWLRWRCMCNVGLRSSLNRWFCTMFGKPKYAEEQRLKSQSEKQSICPKQSWKREKNMKWIKKRNSGNTFFFSYCTLRHWLS